LFCARRHWSVYWLLIVLALTPVAWRTATVINPATRGESPFFSANDRSRWCSVAALVELGTWEIDRVIDGSLAAQAGVPESSAIQWDTIDKVVHRGREGRIHAYSSKPPVLSAMVAAEYWLLNKITGWKLSREPLPVVRTLLTFNHVLGLGLMLVLLASLLEPMLLADWTRYFIVAVAGWGTFLTTFANTLNNHLPAAVLAMATLWLFDRYWRSEGRGRPLVLLGLGLVASLMVAFELPALALLAAVGVLVVAREPVRGTLGLLPGILAVGAAFFWLNWWAHGTIRPAYSFRDDGAEIASLPGELAVELDEGNLPASVAELLRVPANGNPLTGPPASWTVAPGLWPGTADGSRSSRRWIVSDQEGAGLAAITQSGQSRLSIRDWGNWYDYPGSYWRVDNARKSPIDRGEPDPATYACHLLIGHHGALSLTPVWLLAFAGFVPLATSRWLGRGTIGWIAVGVTGIVIAFYLTRAAHDRNYGGQCCCARWLLWLVPLWLVSTAPVVQWLARWGWGRAICLALLAASVLSAMVAQANPWVHPWLYGWWQ
jgi:hypothetical protein